MRYFAALFVLFCLPDLKAGSSDLEVSTFSVEITPKLGTPVGQGFIPIFTSIENPILARGILLRDSGLSCVICTLDLMEVHNESYDFLRREIGKAAGVSESQVALQCIHLHTAPALSEAAHKLEFPEDDPRRIATAAYIREIAGKLSSAIQKSRKEDQWHSVTQIGTGKAEVKKVASNRRIPKPDGSIQGRGSNTGKAPDLRKLPEGLIDPDVRSISFEGKDGAIAQIHFYASHPQSFYGDRRVSYDVPGIIRDRLEKKTGVFQLYITGCGGDIAFGKYNDGSPEYRARIANRLQDGIERSVASLKHETPGPMKWATEPMSFPLRTDKAFTAAANKEILSNPKASAAARRKAAIALAWIERVKSGKPVELSCLSFGKIKMLHLPGEPFVQYQLAAQKMRKDRFVCVAGYGDCGMGYIGGDRIYTDRGGYEQTYAFAGPCEELFLSKMKSLLTDEDDAGR